jgi:DNA ligase-1
MPATEYLAELYKTDSKGKTRHWRIWVQGNEIKTQHGVLDGTLIQASKTIKAGKNVGKANETTPEGQALSEALSTIQKKRDKNYGDVPGHTEIAVLPMLAHNFRKREKDITYPCYVQPKLDGVRCFAYLTDDPDVGVRLISRSGKEFTQPFEKLRSQIAQFIGENEIWDGELYTSKLSFEDLIAACRKSTYRESSELVEFHLFDIFANETETFETRFNTRLLKVAMKVGNRIVPVDTLIADSREDAMEYYSRAMSQGHEGIMFRNLSGLYKAGHRSKDLQKYKEFIDEEFKIHNANEGTGTDEGTVIWVCSTKDKKYFKVRPRGTVEQRKEWWDKNQQFIGNMLTVRYQNLTEDGIPRFPVGIAIRDYE